MPWSSARSQVKRERSAPNTSPQGAFLSFKPSPWSMETLDKLALIWSRFTRI